MSRIGGARTCLSTGALLTTPLRLEVARLWLFQILLGRIGVPVELDAPGRRCGVSLARSGIVVARRRSVRTAALPSGDGLPRRSETVGASARSAVLDAIARRVRRNAMRARALIVRASAACVTSRSYLFRGAVDRPVRRCADVRRCATRRERRTYKHAARNNPDRVESAARRSCPHTRADVSAARCAVNGSGHGDQRSAHDASVKVFVARERAAPQRSASILSPCSSVTAGAVNSAAAPHRSAYADRWSTARPNSITSCRSVEDTAARTHGPMCNALVENATARRALTHWVNSDCNEPRRAGPPEINPTRSGNPRRPSREKSGFQKFQTAIARSRSPKSGVISNLGD